MFAGPNGSGKSTLKSVLPPELLGAYLNPDEIEGRLLADGRLDLLPFDLSIDAGELHDFLSASTRLQLRSLARQAERLQVVGTCIKVSDVAVDSYLAATFVDFVRQKLVAASRSFTFETVMSHPDKIRFLRDARAKGFRTYLYFVATDDPEINKSRVRNRVALGGHDVPEDKIESRYYRSLDLLWEAIRVSNRAYLFDNSREDVNGEHTWIAEITDGQLLELKTSMAPAWFKKSVLEKIGS